MAKHGKTIQKLWRVDEISTLWDPIVFSNYEYYYKWVQSNVYYILHIYSYTVYYSIIYMYYRL